MSRNLRSFDLNLLVVLDALLVERHVTRAANRVGLSQPAMSNALSRLRNLFDDEILVRTPRGMEPTARAMYLAERLGQILRQVERVFDADDQFDPLTTNRRFMLRISDLLEALMLPHVLRPLSDGAPSASFDFMHLSPDETIHALEADSIDAAFSTSLEAPNTVISDLLFEDKLVCVVRQDHPLFQQKWSLDTFLAQRHVRVSISPTDSRFVDNVLAEMDRTRDIALNVPHWLILPTVLAHSDLVAVMSERMTISFGQFERLRVLPLPFETGTIRWMLYWHRRHQGNAAHLWLRRTVLAACAELRQPVRQKSL